MKNKFWLSTMKQCNLLSSNESCKYNLKFRVGFEHGYGSHDWIWIRYRFGFGHRVTFKNLSPGLVHCRPNPCWSQTAICKSGVGPTLLCARLGPEGLKFLGFAYNLWSPFNAKITLKNEWPHSMHSSARKTLERKKISLGVQWSWGLFQSVFRITQVTQNDITNW